MPIPPRRSEIRAVETPKRVLIVDDNVDSAELLEVILSRQGHEVFVAFNAPDAFDLAVEFLPDVAIVDIEMPGEDGYQLAARLREQHLLGACRLVALTGHARESDRRQSEAAGFFRHLTKPFEQAALLEAVTGEGAPPSCAPAKGWTVT